MSEPLLSVTAADLALAEGRLSDLPGLAAPAARPAAVPRQRRRPVAWSLLVGAALKHVAAKILMFLFWTLVAPFSVYVFIAGIHHRVIPPVFPEALFVLLGPDTPIYTFLNGALLLFVMLYVLTELLDPRQDHPDQLLAARYGIVFCLLVDAAVLWAIPLDSAFVLKSLFFWAWAVAGGITLLLVRRLLTAMFW